MPAAPVNDRNPLIRILNLGLLDRQHLPKTGKENGLDYGLTGRDANALQRTCRAAHAHLKMTEQAQINHLMRVCENIRPQAPSERGMKLARFFVTGVIEKKCGVQPQNVYDALNDMCLLSAKLHVAKSTSSDRMIAIVFAVVMHAQGGHLANCNNTLAWIRHMRGLDARTYGDYLTRMGSSTFADAKKLTYKTGRVAGACALVGQAAHVAAQGAGVGKALAIAFVPFMPFVAVQALITTATCVPLAVGLACVSGDAARETVAFAQINFYKDAVMFNMALHPNSWLLDEHHPLDRLEFFDGREPRSAEAVGKERVRRMFDAFNHFTGRFVP